MDLTAFFLDFAVLALLTVTIVFCWRLNGKIAEVKSNSAELSGFLGNFESSILDAQQNIATLRDTAGEFCADLNSGNKRAQELLSDLNIMVDVAAKLSDKLEAQIEQAKKSVVSARGGPKKASTPRKSAKRQVKKASKEAEVSNRS